MNHIYQPPLFFFISYYNGMILKCQLPWFSLTYFQEFEIRPKFEVSRNGVDIAE